MMSKRRPPLVLCSTGITDRLVLSGIREGLVEYGKKAGWFRDPDRANEWDYGVWLEISYTDPEREFFYIILENPFLSEEVGLPQFMVNCLDERQREVIKEILREGGSHYYR
jgi:hypothetical protein